MGSLVCNINQISIGTNTNSCKTPRVTCMQHQSDQYRRKHQQQQVTRLKKHPFSNHQSKDPMPVLFFVDVYDMQDKCITARPGPSPVQARGRAVRGPGPGLGRAGPLCIYLVYLVYLGYKCGYYFVTF